MHSGSITSAELSKLEESANLVIKLFNEIPKWARDEGLCQINEGADSILARIFRIRSEQQTPEEIEAYNQMDHFCTIYMDLLFKPYQGVEKESDESLMKLEQISDRVIKSYDHLSDWRKTDETFYAMKKSAKRILEDVSKIKKARAAALLELRQMVARYEFNDRIASIANIIKDTDSIHELTNLRSEVQWYFAKVSKMLQFFSQISESAKGEFNLLNLDKLKHSLKELHRSIQGKIEINTPLQNIYKTIPPECVRVHGSHRLSEDMRVSCMQEIHAHLSQYASTLQTRPLTSEEQRHARYEVDTSNEVYQDRLTSTKI